MKKTIYSLLLLAVVLISSVPARSGQERLRVAVNSFDNLNNDKKYAHLSAGFSEALTQGLFQIKNILVVERQGLDRIMREHELAQSGAIDEKSAVKTGRLMGANYLVMGKYQIAGGNVRVFCRLVNVETGAVSRDHSFQVTGSLDGIFTVQDELVKRITASFGISPGTDERRRVETVNRELSLTKDEFKLYLQARKEFYLATPDSYQRAIILYAKALGINGKFALAWAGLATANLYKGYERSWNGQSYDEEYFKALAAARQAIRFAPNLSETNCAMALVHAYWLPRPKRKEAEEWARKALAINENNAEAYFAISKARGGDLEYLKKTIEKDPQYILAYNWLGLVYQKMNMIDKAIEMHRTSIRLNPKWALEYANLAYCLFLQKKYPEAMENINRALQLKPDLKPAHVIKGMIVKASGGR